MNVSELYNKLTDRIPASLSCSWDGDGFEVCHDKNAEVKRVLITLDVTNDAIDYAIENKYDVIVSHHPLLFKGIQEVSDLNFDGARVVMLIKNGISAMSFHTRLDKVEGGVNDTLAKLLDLQNVHVAECDDDCMMRVGELSGSMDIHTFAYFVKEKLNAPALKLAYANENVKCVALLGGAGGDMANIAKNAGADTYITGEFRHHETLNPKDLSVNLIEAGHFYTEYPVCNTLKQFIFEIDENIECDIYFSDKVEVI